MQVNPYLFFNGNCEAALKFYQKVLGARVEGMLRFDTGPADMPVPSDWKDKILHAHIVIGGTTLMGADIPTAEPMRSAYLTLTLDTESDAERVYGLLTDGGEIFMKMEKTHFANRFAMLRDRFGASWMLLHEPK